jgi:hypothetical protein
MQEMTNLKFSSYQSKLITFCQGIMTKIPFALLELGQTIKFFSAGPVMRFETHPDPTSSEKYELE